MKLVHATLRKEFGSDLNGEQLDGNGKNLGNMQGELQLYSSTAALLPRAYAETSGPHPGLRVYKKDGTRKKKEERADTPRIRAMTKGRGTKAG